MFKNALMNEMVAFVAVAEFSSFTLAAASLNSTKSGTGKAVRKLEAELGLKLFNRTTRSVSLTEEGRIYFEAAKHALDTINETRLLLEARKDEPTGKLRVNLPNAIGRNIVNTLREFTDNFPKVTVELSLTDRFEDAVQGEWDVVVRIGELDDSSFVAKSLGQAKRILCASPRYIEEFGAPKDLNALRNHNSVAFRAPTGKIRPWLFKDASGKTSEISISPIAVFNDGRALVDAVVSGLGIAQVYDKAVSQALKSGDMVELLPSTSISGPPVNALIPSGRVMPAKTKVFIEFLKTHLS
ncbi:LysR family transcriptional regulator [Vibrio hannami]|uniref:LysR family transcriptional regulator n=1 Tax=Vibrio hannami TaxID=2717094 RepID=UPI00240EEAE6|nr:LysR family transcriptional regulator [Vibrio hannami]MDG3085067.1 LysR family transcriptional regulator [Vibrio hannami]